MKKVLRVLLGVLLLAAVLAFGAFYLLIYEDEPVRFPSHTTVNSVDVSGLTAEQAEAKISDHMRGEVFSLEYQGEEYDVPLSDLSFRLPLDSALSDIGMLRQLLSCIGIGNSIEVQVKAQDSDEFVKTLSELPFCDNTGKRPSEDAYIDMSDFELRVVKEKIGTEIDPARIMNIIFTDIAEGESSASLSMDEIVALPAITEDSEEFQDRLKYCRDNLSFKLSYDLSGTDYVITPDKLDEMVTYGKDGAEFNNDVISSLMTEIASQCNEYNEHYRFVTHSGRKVTVTGVNFGKYLDKEAMAEDLRQALEAQQPQQLELKWGQVKYNDGTGIGDSYIEVSIKDQHVWCYKNGKVVVDCDCVTGVPGHDTSKGVFVVQYVTGPTTLRGQNDDGSTYESPVNCFIPFYGDQGFHGSNGWRSKWGGDIYKTAGSHGCVNCPDAAAAKMADTVGPGYPVVIY